jgi:hypothetical protein
VALSRATVFSPGIGETAHGDYLQSSCVRRLTLPIESAPMRPVKFLFPLFLFAAFAFSACNTVENRRSMYTTQKVHGPYTTQLEEGTWGNPKTVTEEYAEGQKVKKQPKLIPGQKKASSDVPAVTVPTPETQLPQ